MKFTDTQLKALKKALKELLDIEQDETCNDCLKGDKFYLLSKKERAEAIALSDCDWAGNFTATEYLLKLIKQVKKK